MSCISAFHFSERPLNISNARIDLATGLLTNKSDYTTRFEYFKNGTVPTKYVDSASFTEEQDGIEYLQDKSSDDEYELF